MEIRNIHGYVIREIPEKDLSEANLREADLRGANLRKADLRGADLWGANLQRATLDLSCWPLSCGSFGLIADDRLIAQLVCHITRLDISHCGRITKMAIKALFPFRNLFCRYRDDVAEI